jgi:hypothetical protein
VVEGARLESVYRGNSIESSNLSVSANLFKTLPFEKGFSFYAVNKKAFGIIIVLIGLQA